MYLPLYCNLGKTSEEKNQYFQQKQKIKNNHEQDLQVAEVGLTGNSYRDIEGDSILPCTAVLFPGTSEGCLTLESKMEQHDS